MLFASIEEAKIPQAMFYVPVDIVSANTSRLTIVSRRIGMVFVPNRKAFISVYYQQILLRVLFPILTVVHAYSEARLVCLYKFLPVISPYRQTITDKSFF